MKLHLGCGRTRLDGWVNVDCSPVEGVTDVVVDLDGADLAQAFEPDSVTESLGAHVLEHLTRPLEFMAALWDVTAPGGTASFEVPYGTSDDAWEDPTHVRPYFVNSWAFFAQPAYFRADYGYRGDWRTTDVVLAVDPARWSDSTPAGVLEAVRRERNVVEFMRATLEAVKPARAPLAELRESIPVRVAFARDSR